MGRSMCLLNAGYTLGAALASIAALSDIVFSIVGPSHVCYIILHPTSGALTGLEPNKTLVDMTTSDPSLTPAATKSCSAGKETVLIEALR